MCDGWSGVEIAIEELCVYGRRYTLYVGERVVVM